jgi:hypothetical protein
MSRYLLPLLAVPFLGCSSPGNDYQVKLDPAFSAEETWVILDSLRDWEDKVNASHTVHLSLHPSIGWGLCHDSDTICIHRSTAARVFELSEGAHPYGFTIRQWNGIADCWIAMDQMYGSITVYGVATPALHEGIFQEVIGHEVGHGMDLRHIPAGNMMSPLIDSVHATCADVEEYLAVRGMDHVPCKKDDYLLPQ